MSRYAQPLVVSIFALAMITYRLRRRRRDKDGIELHVAVHPSDRYAAVAAARNWPMKAVEPYTLLIGPPPSGKGIPKSRLHVSLRHEHDRKPHVSDAATMDRVWSAKLAKAKASGGRLFDQSKFRLHGIVWAGDETLGGDGGGDDAALMNVQIGLTSYKEYVCSNLLPDVDREEMEADGAAAHGDSLAHLSNALGCEAMLVTSDGQAVLLRRSGAVATGSGLYNGPSGHAEPSNAGISTHAADTGQSVANALARDELYGAILAEVHEETNVPLSDLSPPLLIGAMADSHRKPDLLFQVSTRLDSHGVRAAYARGASEGWESDKLTFWPAATLVHCDTLPLTAVTRAAAACFAALRSQDA